jgi:uncharacterized membrane protein
MRKPIKKFEVLSLKVPFSLMEKITAGISILMVVGLIAATILLFPRMPQQIPTHFDASGQADKFGSKLLLLIVPAMAVVICAYMLSLGFSSKFYNSARNAPETIRQQFILVRKLVLSMNLVIALLMIYIQSSVFSIAANLIHDLGILPLVIFVIMIFTPLLVFLKKSRALRHLAVRKSGKGKLRK